MRWPLGPPHMTLKPSKKNTKKTTKPKKTKKKEKKQEKTRDTQKWAFQLSVKISFFFGWVSNIALFRHLGPKSAHPKNTIKIGVSGPFVLRSRCASRNGHFWTKKPKFINSNYHFLLLQQQKTHKIAETPILLCFSKPNKREFSKFKLKTPKIEKPNFCTLFWKRLFLENCQIIGHQKNTKW